MSGICIVFSVHGKVVLSYEKRKLIIFTLHISINRIVDDSKRTNCFERKSHIRILRHTEIDSGIMNNFSLICYICTTHIWDNEHFILKSKIPIYHRILKEGWKFSFFTVVFLQSQLE